MLTSRVRRLALVAAVLAYACALGLGQGQWVVQVDDLGACVAALAACAAAAVRARTRTGRTQLSWALVSASFGSAALGELLWTWYELVLGQETPYPSPADAFYLVFPVLALIGMLLRPSSAFAGQGRARAVLDGLLISGSLFVLGWVSSLGAVFADTSSSTLQLAVSLAYPIGDLLVLTTVMILLARNGRSTELCLLAGSLAVLALSDSAYTYLTSLGTYSTGNLLDVGYLAGYLLAAEAALVDTRDREDREDREASWAVVLLPYVPLAAAVAVLGWHLGSVLLDPALAVGSSLVVLVVIRQALTVVDNRILVARVLESQAQLRYAAFHDGLTSLANRALFQDRLSHAVELHQRHLRPVSVLMIDLDDFKSVNDSLGHAAGDELLITVADRLRSVTRAADTVARLGGDEFAIVREEDDDPIDLADQVLLALSRPLVLQGRVLRMQASIGVTLLNADAAPLEASDLLRRADLAMYAAKQAGKGCAASYEEGMTDEADDLDLRSDLVRAVHAGEVTVFFQPVYGLTGTLIGFEALSRWARAGVPVAPDVFIPAAERAGVLQLLDENVLEQSLTLLRDAPGQVFVTVNAGAAQLTDPGFAEHVRNQLTRHGIEAGRLVIEVPEHKALEQDAAAARHTLDGLRAAGVRLALDDFGVGYSSLARLQEFPAHIVKIDRCFITPLGRPGADSELLSAMIDLAHRTGSAVIAEGVERQEELTVLRDLGCDAVQGYLLGRPVPAREAAALMRTVTASAVV
ncbi:MAG: hypothetical protein JWO12_2375 [Frankiales bacterium]|nr:hypothetical protein [Frankiales bacterium]